MNPHRVAAMVLRYIFLFTRTPIRLADIFFWPVMDLLVWGFLTMYMLQVENKLPALVTFLIGAIIFWDILYRAQQAVTVSFLEDVWTRNFLNIFVSPVRNREFIAATYIMGLAQAVLVVIVMSVLAYFFYGFDLLKLGLVLMPLAANLLVMGWTMGLVTTALIFRWGQSAEALAWAVPFLVQPISAVFYPVHVLPAWLQPIAYAMPAAHVFECLRHMWAGHNVDYNSIFYATGLNILYMAAAALFFQSNFNRAKNLGLLTKLGT